MIEHRSLWELAVLCLLREKPMHPYEMQGLVQARHVDQVLVLKRGSLYHAIDRLVRSLLIEVIGTGKNGRRPERTTYRITAAGELELTEWLRRMIATPRREQSEFMASVSFLIHLVPADAITQLDERARKLSKEVADIEASIQYATPFATRVNLLEGEYFRAMRHAELQWVRGLTDELRSGRLTWDLQAIFREVWSAQTVQTLPKES